MFIISYPFDVIILLKTQVHSVYVLYAQLIFITTALFFNSFRLILDSSDGYWMFVVALELLSDENANMLRCYYIFIMKCIALTFKLDEYIYHWLLTNHVLEKHAEWSKRITTLMESAHHSFFEIRIKLTLFLIVILYIIGNLSNT